MKQATFILTILGLVFSNWLLAQSPEKISYQAIVRDASNNLVASQNIGMQISVLQGSETGIAVYVETQSPTTNTNGLISIEIGTGTTSNDFSTIDWASGPYYVQSEIDITGGSSYTITSTAQLLSVPYALHAKTVENADDADADPTNEIQNLSFTSDSIKISDGTGILMPNGLNLWSSDGSNVFLANGNVGLGTTTPSGKLEVKGNAIDTPDDLLFAVVNNDGDTVFAVYQGSVVINVDETSTKGSKGGFAVASMGTGAKSAGNELLRVTSDSIRIYIDETSTKGSKGGFAVASMGTGAKGSGNDILKVTKDSTRIYVEDSDAGFEVNNTESGSDQSLMTLTKENYFIGHESGSNITPSGDSLGKFNAFLGYQTGTTTTTGYRNVLLGYQAGQNITSGFDNTFIGFNTGQNADTAAQNVYIGTNVGIAAAGQKNIMIGDSAGYSDTEGNNNIFLGHASGFNNISGHHNVFLGPYSGTENTSGGYNVFLGNEAGFKSTSGTDNVYIGDKAGYQSSLGSHNIYIGGQSGISNVSGDNNVFIGYKSGFNEVNKFDRLIIENSDADSTQALIYGDFAQNTIRFNDKVGIGMNAGTNELELHGSAFKDDGSTAWLTISDKRIKTNITDIEKATELIQKLRPVTYYYNDLWKSQQPEVSTNLQYGFIAQEYQEVFPNSVKGSGKYLKGDENEILTIDIHNAQIITVKAVQELIQNNQDLNTELEILKAQFEILKAEIEHLKTK